MVRIRYLALGDSYTIGTGLPDESGNFPSQLARRLESAGESTVEVRNLGVNGYTTADLIRRELPAARGWKPDLVTVLIGANDVVQGVDETTFWKGLSRIYDSVEQFELPSGRVVVVSIPDFSVVPVAGTFGSPAHLGLRIETFNRIAEQEAGQHGFSFVDVSELSRSGIRRADWLAPDGLHPAAAQYTVWVDAIWAEVGARWSGVRPAV